MTRLLPHGVPPNAILDQYRPSTAGAAQALNDLRERWLNPPEWAVERILEFSAEEAKAAKVKKPRTSRLKHADELI